MMKYLIIGLLFIGCKSMLEPYKPREYDPTVKHYFFFSQYDFEHQYDSCVGWDKLCVVNDYGTKRVFYYTWCWPASWAPVHRNIQRDEIYLGKGYRYETLPDSQVQTLTLLKFNDLFSK